MSGQRLPVLALIVVLIAIAGFAYPVFNHISDAHAKNVRLEHAVEYLCAYLHIQDEGSPCVLP